jgi:predicted transposase/invertase (TIGR01784 family)
MPKRIHNPHDAFFRLSLHIVSIAKDFFQANLPNHILQKIDLDTLEIQAGSFVDEALKATQTDILYRVNFEKEKGYLYLLAEQQDKPQKMMAFRLLCYLFSIMKQHLDQGNKDLPIVYAVVVYTGKRSPYPYSMDVFDLFEHKKLAKEILYQPFQLVDLGQLSDAKLSKNRLASIMLRLLKNKDKPEILSLIIDMKSAGLFELAENLGLYNYLLGMIEYIIDQTETQQDANKAVAVLSEALPNERDNIMTIAERLKLQGHREGLEEGLHQGAEKEKRLTAKRMLKKGFPDEEVVECTTISDKILRELKKELEKDQK